MSSLPPATFQHDNSPVPGLVWRTRAISPQEDSAGKLMSLFTHVPGVTIHVTNGNAFYRSNGEWKGPMSEEQAKNAALREAGLIE
jgi:hypothetical protein